LSSTALSKDLDEFDGDKLAAPSGVRYPLFKLIGCERLSRCVAAIFAFTSLRESVLGSRKNDPLDRLSVKYLKINMLAAMQPRTYTFNTS